MAGQGGPNVDLFDAYFRRADLDQDGRISGAEAVAFFQGSNLSKQILAQIWMHADPRSTGYLGRPEFYNALKLVTVAQSKRELTPDIVKAALYGPASTKIPAPHINLASIPPPRMNTTAPVPAPQMAPQVAAVSPANSQNVGFKGQQVPPNAGGGIINQQQYYASQGNQLRPPTPMSVGTASRPPHSSDFSNSNNPTNWLGNRSNGPPNRGISPSSAPPNPQDQLSKASTFTANAPKASPDPMFGGDMFSATRSLAANQSSSAPTPTYSVGVTPVSSTTLPVTTGPQSSTKPNPLDSLQKTFPRQSTGPQPWLTQSQPKSNQEPSSGISAGGGNPTSTWPKMTRAGVQKYAKVFVEVDTDRDGKITGEQARNLFLSWRLPREVLKQVWDLSDQDNDSMLSLREFCIALYLMERYREGHPLPPELPSTILLDETLLSIAGPPYGGGAAAWGSAAPPPGLRSQQGMPGVQQRMAPTGLRPPVHGMLQNDGTVPFNQQQKGRVPLAENSHLNQFDNGETNPLDSKAQNTEDMEKKVQSTILDSREKMEFYRTKMQDLVLYKSRCDNRLNEISERALADKREAELLGKKYEEKYKQVAEIASKLTIEEASFRDVQERKMELNQAIVKMEQGGSADGILQVRADRIQSDMEELLKALSERCKKHGVNVKSTVLIQLPIGWQPGIPEVSSVWDEEWDKFEDEGFSFDVANGKSSAATVEKEPLDSFPPEDSFSDAAAADVSKADEHDHLESESVAYNFHSEEDDGSSPARQTTFESPSKEYSDNHFTDAETQRRESFDEPSWGTFDNNEEDIDSVWGFSTSNTTKEEEDKYMFGSSGFGTSPTRTESPDNKYGGGGGGVDSFFANSSRFDSFSTRGGFSPPKETSFTRFDSISSSRGGASGFSFDDSDPFGSTGPFKVSSDNQKSFS